MTYRLIEKEVYITKESNGMNEDTHICRCSRPCIQLKLFGLFWITIATFYYEDASESNKNAIKCFNNLINYTDNGKTIS
jgi:hypothetical protein